MRNSVRSTPIAVIGMDCRLPGASSIEDFWRLIRSGGCTVQPMPEERFERELYFHPDKGVRGKSYADFGCLVEYSFDESSLPRSVRECPEIAFRTLYSVAAGAMRQAGIDASPRHPRHAGVYVGHTRSSGLAGDIAYATYIGQTAKWLRRVAGIDQVIPGRTDELVRRIIDDVRRECPCRDDKGGPAVGAHMAAGLLSAAFGFSGPYMSFNSACASSLHALAQAVRALQLGRLEMAVVGGASYCHHDTFVMFSQAQSLTANRASAFDENADGLVIGEGYAAVVLKTLDRALADGDPIQAVICGVGIASDGRGKSLWAPRAEGQIKAVRRAYEDGLDASRLRFIEAHATSTQLGDATEVGALAKALGDELPKNARVALGSVKTQIGHTLETAGLSSLIKTILCLQNKTIPAAIGITRLTPKIDWDAIPFHVPQQPSPWRTPADGSPRRGAVNAFGIGGLNVHVVVDEYLPSVASSSSTVATATPTDNAVAIVGVGAVLPGARSFEAFLDLVREGRDPKRTLPPGRWDGDVFHRGRGTWGCSTLLGGYIDDFEYDWRRNKIPPKQIQNASPLQFMILEAVDQALTSGGYFEKPFDRTRVGVVVGNTFGGEFSNKLLMGLRLPDFRRRLTNILASMGATTDRTEQVADLYEEILLAKMPALLDETGSFTSSSLASRITKSFDLMGGAVAVDAGAASSGAALACCVDQLLAGDNEMMICIGGQEDLSPTKYVGLDLSRQLSHTDPLAPFDANASGCVPGEGCGVLLLKKLTTARADRDKILGIIRGVGVASGNDLRDASRTAAARAMAEAGVNAEDVAAIDSTSNGVPARDAAELSGLLDAYRTPYRCSPIRLSSVTAQVGHSVSAAGVTAVLKSLGQLDRQEMSATFGQNTIAPAPQDAEQMATVTETTPLHANQDGRLFAAVHETGQHDLAYHVLIERGSPVSTSRKQVSPSVTKTGLDIVDGIEVFDATDRRKQRMRKQALERADGPFAGPPDPVVATPLPAPTLEPARTAKPQAAKTIAAPIRSSNGSAPAAKSGPDRAELESFLVNFVVEQTGYPTEIVEMDADLEADLGIDSIKKAQLFGELREYFDITPDENLSLDDFPTLRHVQEFLLAADGATSTAMTPPGGREEVDLQPAVVSTPRPTSTAPDAGQLDAFLVNFVVEQTGYPPEIVELDADLEADLGIDSIKKAQLFGELREYFDITPDENLTLDDFATLRHVQQFLAETLPVSGSSFPAAVSAPPEPVVTQSAVDGNGRARSAATVASTQTRAPRELEAFLVNFVVEQTGYPPEIVEMDADLEADLGIDSIKKAQLFGELREYFEVTPDENLSLDDFPTLRHVAEYLHDT